MRRPLFPCLSCFSPISCNGRSECMGYVMYTAGSCLELYSQSRLHMPLLLLLLLLPSPPPYHPTTHLPRRWPHCCPPRARTAPSPRSPSAHRSLSPSLRMAAQVLLLPVAVAVASAHNTLVLRPTPAAPAHPTSPAPSPVPPMVTGTRAGVMAMDSTARLSRRFRP